MRASNNAIFYFLLQISIFQDVSGIQIWSSPGALPTTIPASCRAVLSQNITCNPQLINAAFISAGRALDNVTATEYCTPTCYSSIKTFKTNVDLRCGSTSYAMYANSTFEQSGAQIADPLAWAYNVTCIEDSTGFCLADLYNGTKTACSDCSLKYGAAMLSSDYGRVKVQPSAFSSLLSSCGTPASSYPYTYTSTSTTSTSTSTATSTANCTGTTYTVTSADTCQSISQSNSIAIDRLIAQNELDYNCTSLTSGSSLCLGESCALQTITANQTCADIIGRNGFTTIQLISWNPTIHSNCDNLDSMVGRSICVSPPGTTNYTTSQMNITTSTLSSMFSGPWTTGTADMNPPNMTTEWYNTQTTFPAGATGTYLANATLSSLVAERTIYCPITDQNYTDGITEADLPDACAPLIEPYCWPNISAPIPTSTRFPAVCTPTLDPTTTSTAAAVPSPTEPETVDTCTKYYQVLDGDSCSSIASNFDITLDQFDTWNPYVGTDCVKLFLGYYVCIKASS
ncbi:LysM domain-containing protein [Sclerotinia borealis F-4128]|uniref:LysM domain-containing protein n=1 Tax=Sclerotinia borealis (strain F-4128) TaxID=1432307 RepID=W9C3U2_SCLBF|nr:LysM domain-containing protein [Sclerotinia borealis F-4128]